MGRDTFGDCPTSWRVCADDEGAYVSQWCSIATWRRLEGGAQDVWRLRADRWARTGEATRHWHERHMAGSIDEPVRRVD